MMLLFPVQCYTSLCFVHQPIHRGRMRNPLHYGGGADGEEVMDTDVDHRIMVAIDKVRTEIAHLRADMEKRFGEQTRWINGQVWRIITWTTVLVLGAAGFIIRFG